MDIDGDLPACHSHRGMAWLAVARKAGPTSALSGLLRIAGCDGVEVIVGRRFRLSRVMRILRFSADPSLASSCWQILVRIIEPASMPIRRMRARTAAHVP